MIEGKTVGEAAVVCGCNFCNILTMARALGKAGYDVEVLRVFKTTPNKINLLRTMKPEAYSKYVKSYYECIVNGDWEKVFQSLEEMSDCGKKKLLMPVDDYTACLVDQYYEKLNQYFIAPNINQKTGEITRLMDKNNQKDIAGRFGLPMLNSILIKSENGYFVIPDEVKYPCFMKPNVSMKSTKARMKKCETKNELNRYLTEYAQKEDFEVLVEDFADIAAEYSVLGISTQDITIAPAVFRVLEGGHKERKGVTITGVTEDTSRFKNILDECEKFVKSLNYTGLFDVDLIETKDGNIYFIELNFRAGASMHVFTETGMNLPGTIADYLVKAIPIDATRLKDKKGKLFVSEKVLMEEYARSDTNIKRIKQLMSEADVCFIKDDMDPNPYKYFRKFYFIAMLMRIPYRIRDWKQH